MHHPLLPTAEQIADHLSRRPKLPRRDAGEPIDPADHVGRDALERILTGLEPVYLEALDPAHRTMCMDAAAVPAEILPPEVDIYGRAARELGRVIFFAATLGGELDRRTDLMIRQGRHLDALVLDAMGSLGIEAYVEKLQEGAASSFTTELHLGWRLRRFSPGYGGWGLHHQPQLLSSLRAGAIGMTCTKGFQLCPRKSVTGLIAALPPQKPLSSIRRSLDSR